MQEEYKGNEPSKNKQQNPHLIIFSSKNEQNFTLILSLPIIGPSSSLNQIFKISSLLANNDAFAKIRILTSLKSPKFPKNQTLDHVSPFPNKIAQIQGRNLQSSKRKSDLNKNRPRKKKFRSAPKLPQGRNLPNMEEEKIPPSKENLPKNHPNLQVAPLEENRSSRKEEEEGMRK